jgi:hypothetical protein
MKKGYLVGGLAVLGVIALMAYLKKPKKNSDGFFSANGLISKAKQNWCAHRNTDGSVSYATNNLGGDCPRGWVSVTAFGDRIGV